MATIEKFEDVLAWQKGRELTQLVYKFSKREEFARDFALKDQMRRAAISVTSNIAEGFERAGNKEFLQFLSNSKGSAGELRSQFYVALDEEYLDSSEFRQAHELCLQVGRMIDSFMTYLRRSEMKGRKFQDRGGASSKP